MGVLPTLSSSKQHAVVVLKNPPFAKLLLYVLFRNFGRKIGPVIIRSSAGQADESDDCRCQTDEVSFAFQALTHFDFAVTQFGPN
jgi:hypothetical protein